MAGCGGGGIWGARVAFGGWEVGMRIRRRQVRAVLAGALGVALAGGAVGAGMNGWVLWAACGRMFRQRRRKP